MEEPMAVAAQDRTDLDLAHAFAQAYRDVDSEALRSLLSPVVRVRVLAPPGFKEIKGPDGMISELGEFFANWSVEEVDAINVALLSANRMQTGRMAQITQRFRLRQADGEQAATMLVTHLIAIADGRIALVDELCSGVMPDTH